MPTTYFWGFDFGLKWFGDAVQKKDDRGVSFPVKESWSVPENLAQRGPATKSGTPANQYRALKVREARKAREEWFEKIWEDAGLPVLRGRQLCKMDEQGNVLPEYDWKKKKGRWQPTAEPPEQRENRERLEREFAKSGDDTCYTSCLLRIKLMRSKETKEKLAPWQIFKALRSAIQKRGYDGEPPWTRKEAARAGMSTEEFKKKQEAELEKKDPKFKEAAKAWKKFQSGFKAWEDEKSDPNRKPIPEQFHQPCYYDAFQMGLWNPEKPEYICFQQRHTAASTRDVRFPRKAVNDEIIALGNLAANEDQLPALKSAFEKLQRDGWLVTDEVTWYDSENKVTKRGRRVRKLQVLAQSFGEFLCYGPGGKEYAAYDPKTVKELEIEISEHPDPSQIGKSSKEHKRHQLRRGTELDWLGGVGQKIPRIDNRIVEPCALIPRLHVCRVAPAWKKAADGAKQLDIRFLLAAEVTFVMQLKNLQVDDPTSGGVRHLWPVELKEWLDKIRAEQVVPKVAELNFSDGWEGKVLECFKITKPQWRTWCGQKGFEPIGVERADTDAQNDGGDATELSLLTTEDEADESGATTGGKSKNDVVKSSKPNGRSRFSRPTLAILKHILLHDESPIEFAEKLRSRDRGLLDEVGLFDIFDEPPLRADRDHVAFEKKGGPWLLLKDLDFLNWIWKPTDEKGNPRKYEPYQLRIPDMALRHLRKKFKLSDKPKPYTQLLQEHSQEIKHRESQPNGNGKFEATELERQQQAVHELIGQQNNPRVRDRLTRFWRRLQYFQNPEPGLGLPDPECVALEFVRDDKDNSLEGKKRAENYKRFLANNEKRRNHFRKILEDDGFRPTDEMIVKRMLLHDQGGACIYENVGISCSNLRNVQIEHIVPRSRGGPDAYFNWVLCTEDANAEKGNRVPYEWFHQEKTDEEWIAYKERVKRHEATLGKTKVNLLLRADAAQLVGEKYTALATTSWIARIAQSIVRLHFGWQPDDEPGTEKVITISGGLTARIRRKYLLDSLLGNGNDRKVCELRKGIDDVLNEIEKLRQHPEPHSEEAKAKRDELRQKQSALARSSEKNREDQRHHALDAMLLTFLPNWARDKDKEDFFRFDGIGDTLLYSEEGRQQSKILKDQIKRIYKETEPDFKAIKAARDAGEFQKMEFLKKKIFKQRKDIAQLYRSVDKLKQPRNIRAVRNWFRTQIEGERPVLPRPAAFERPSVEASLYRRAYLLRRGHVQPTRIPLTELGRRADFWDDSKLVFDLKWLEARIHSITDANDDYERVKLKRLLGDKLKAAITNCRAQNRECTEADWQTIAAGEDIRGLFRRKGKNKAIPAAADCKVKVFAVDVVPVKRYTLFDLAYEKGKSDIWNPDYFESSIGNILRRDENQPRRRSRGQRNVRPATIQPSQQSAAQRCDGFVDDLQTREKLQKLRGEVAQFEKLLPGPKPKDEAGKNAWNQKAKALDEAIEEFVKKHDLLKYPFLAPPEGDRPPKRYTPWKRIFFESKDRTFSTDELKTQAENIVGANRNGDLTCFADCLMRFAENLTEIPDNRHRESLWQEFCKDARVVTKKSIEKFIAKTPSPSAKEWLEFFQTESGALVKRVELVASWTGFSEYFDLSKDRTGQFAKAGGMGGRPSNKGYLICQNKTDGEVRAFPVRFFESEKKVQAYLNQTGWELLDTGLWRKGDLLRLANGTLTKPPKGKQPKDVPGGYYSLGSISNGKDVNLNACLGGESPRGISLKLLWDNGLRRATKEVAKPTPVVAHARLDTIPVAKKILSPLPLSEAPRPEANL